MLRELQQKTNLSNAQFNGVIQVALDHEKEASLVDRRAQAIIDDFRAKYPPGNMPVGTVPPAPPQELLDLQDERNATSLRYRDRLKAELGDAAYINFKKFVDAEFTPKISTEKITQQDIPAPSTTGVK